MPAVGGAPTPRSSGPAVCQLCPPELVIWSTASQRTHSLPRFAAEPNYPHYYYQVSVAAEWLQAAWMRWSGRVKSFVALATLAFSRTALRLA